MINAFLELLHRSGIPACARRLPRRHLTVLNFHRVRDTASDFHDGMIELDSCRFRAQIAWLAARTDLLRESDLESLEPGARPKVLLTFDDGYRDAHDVIAPILEDHGASAIFFVSPGLLDRRTLGAWDRIAYLVKKFGGPSFRFRGRDFFLESGRSETYLALGRWNQESLPDRSDEFVAELASALGLEIPETSRQSAELLTWDQVRDLQRRGFAIGCHSFTHRVLSSLSLREQEEEILLARSRLEAERARAVSFAYPYGNPYTYSRETREAVMKAGFRHIFSFSGQAPRIGGLDHSRIDRVAFKSSLAKYDFLLAFPALHNVAHRLRNGRQA